MLCLNNISPAKFNQFRKDLLTLDDLGFVWGLFAHNSSLLRCEQQAFAPSMMTMMTNVMMTMLMNVVNANAMTY
jgi:hypothetical protein